MLIDRHMLKDFLLNVDWLVPDPASLPAVGRDTISSATRKQSVSGTQEPFTQDKQGF